VQKVVLDAIELVVDVIVSCQMLAGFGEKLYAAVNSIPFNFQCKK
jgi:hypothetical protein